MKICFITGTRADYGILSHLMRELRNRDGVELQVIATNMHLSPEYGLTYREIEADGFRIDKRVEMLLSSDTPTGITKSTGLGMIGMADAIAELSPDLIVILGDRYEMMAAATAAMIAGVPVAHLHGGEITEGAFDDSLRHAISKLSYLHFTAAEEHRQRLIRMGEAPDRVHCVGSPAVDSIHSEPLLSIDELEASIGHRLGHGFIIVTFHPVTREPGQAAVQTKALLAALEEAAGTRTILFTLPNSDTEGRTVASLIREWAADHADRAVAVTSLGQQKFYSAMSHCAAVVGNSSGGLIEAPSFGVPTLNIGNRQKGRTRGNTVVDCVADREAIVKGLNKVLSHEFAEFVKTQGTNPYHKEGSVKRIADIITSTPLRRHPQKPFYE